MKKFQLLIFVSFTFSALFVHAQAQAGRADDILGLWWTKDKKAKVRMEKCGNAYCGKLVWLSKPVYENGEREGWDGKEKLDYKNPDESKHNQPVKGLQIVNNLEFEDGIWQSGTVYDPDNGKTYKCKAEIETKDVLALRGFIGFSLFGRTSEWMRIE